MVSLAGRSIFPQNPLNSRLGGPPEAVRTFFLTKNRPFPLPRLELYIVHPAALALAENMRDEVSVLRPEDDPFGSKHVAKM